MEWAGTVDDGRGLVGNSVSIRTSTRTHWSKMYVVSIHLAMKQLNQMALTFPPPLLALSCGHIARAQGSPEASCSEPSRRMQ